MAELTAERWQRVKHVFLAAVQCHDAQRRKLLDHECAGDAALRTEVESLLACHERAVGTGFLDSLGSSSSDPRQAMEALAAAFEVTQGTKRTQHDAPATSGPSGGHQDAAPRLASRSRFGDYEILDELGHGGMGIVYKARQLSLNRIVALKMILAGRISSREEVERFRQEAEAAARLDHAGIAAVYEVGEVEGRHYYSMAYIDGESLADRLKAAGGPIGYREAAHLVQEIAAAIQHAHTHGVIHRDLKPSNILLDDGKTPRVVDFGLAKRVETDSGLTVSGQVLGTPSYISPEQAAGKTHQVGPEADVYALGALLYALITGKPPFAAATIAETLRQVQEEEPVRPRLLNSSLPADLETISLKCLEKLPAGRYASAQALADELARFLDGRPIQARPISRSARAYRWCRRNPMAAAFLAFVLVSVPAVFTALGIMNYRLGQEKVRAELRFRDAIRAVNEQFTLVSEETLLDQPGLQPVRRKLLLGAKKYYEGFLQERSDDPALRAETALVYFRLGVITEQLRPAGDDASLDEALDYYEKARTTQRSLSDARPEAEAVLGDVWTGIGRVRTKKQLLVEAYQAFDAALEIRKRVATSLRDADNQRKLANGYMNLAIAEMRLAPEKGLHLLERAQEKLHIAQTLRHGLLDADPNDPAVLRDLAKGYLNLSQTIVEPSDPEFRHFLLEAVDHFEVVVEQVDHSLEDAYLLSVTYLSLADLHATRSGDKDRGLALGFYEQARDHLAVLAAQNPDVAEYSGSLARAYINIGDLQRDVSPAEARHAFEQAIKMLDPLLETGEQAFFWDYLESLWALAQVQLELEPDKPEPAIDSLRLAARLLQSRLAEADGDERTDYEQYLDKVNGALKKLQREATE